MPDLLIVDDDASIRAMFARALRSLGEIEEASGGAQAVRRLSARRFDLVLLDLHMPAVDGFAVLETLATKPGPNRETPIFVVTADDSETSRLRAFRSHSVFLLTKPVHLATLVSLAESSLKKAASRATPPPERPRATPPPERPRATPPPERPLPEKPRKG